MLETGEGDAGDILQKLLKLPGRMGSLSQRVACGVLHVPRDPPYIPNIRDKGRDGKGVA